MSRLFEINSEKCTGCGSCVSDCPMGIIAMHKNRPIPLMNADQRCITCGHCVSVCPTGAFSLHKIPVDTCIPVNESIMPGAEQVEMLLKTRRSIRQFKSQPVDKEILSKILEISCYAPTATNSQQVSWRVIYETDEVKKIAEAVINWMREAKNNAGSNSMASYFEPMIAAWDKGKDPVCRNAPHLVLTFAPNNAQIRMVDCSIALTYLMLAAVPFGVGTCWAGIIQMAAQASPAINQVLEVPEGHQCFGAMMMGYSKVFYPRIPLRKDTQVTWK